MAKLLKWGLTSEPPCLETSTNLSVIGSSHWRWIDFHSSIPTAVLPLFASAAKPERCRNNCICCLSLVKHVNVSDVSTMFSQLMYPYGLLGKSATQVKVSVEFNTPFLARVWSRVAPVHVWLMPNVCGDSQRELARKQLFRSEVTKLSLFVFRVPGVKNENWYEITGMKK